MGCFAGGGDSCEAGHPFPAFKGPANLFYRHLQGPFYIKRTVTVVVKKRNSEARALSLSTFFLSFFFHDFLLFICKTYKKVEKAERKK